MVLHGVQPLSRETPVSPRLQPHEYIQSDPDSGRGRGLKGPNRLGRRVEPFIESGVKAQNLLHPPLQGVPGSSHGRQQWGQRHTPERGITVLHSRGGAGHRWHDHIRESEYGERGLEWGGPGPLWGDPHLAGRSQECRRSWAGKVSTLTCLSPSFQVVDLLNQAALITNDSKITVLKQVRGRG